MSPDRRPLELAFSEPAVDQVLPAAEQARPLPAGSSPFLEPDPIVPGPSAARRLLAPQA
ncbi:hypothetical protein [Kitasatospora griseola]|uniref:hypothetical protein n=1 Tax=Kitasatospora griseola TaxID=2064 RepID=UPI0016711D32|nr:hypothetical protein [Kitasatospora griseola]GGR01989.1 hypothetical protein GCM10010195_67190 [Kitasatospora griseola]